MINSKFLNVWQRTETTPEIDEELLRKLLPPYKVILHNDDHTPMELVIIALLKSVPSLNEEDAVNIMLTAHNEGTAVVITCPKETAELYQSRIISYKINCTIELDD